jgi:hypothetical protein
MHRINFITGIEAIVVALALLGFIVVLAWRFVARMVRMPGRSFRGPLPSWSDREISLSARLRSHVEMLAGTIGARSLTSAPENLALAEKYITETIASNGLQPERHEFTLVGLVAEKRMEKAGTPMRLAGLKTANIIAEIRGVSRPEEIVLVGAHYDSVFDCPAANDNGSGVAAILELTRMLAGLKLSRTVRFVAFTNEEPPFFRSEDMGSTRYARLCREQNQNIVAMLSLETIGCYTDAPGSQKYPWPFNLLYPSRGNFVSFVGNSHSRALVRNVWFAVWSKSSSSWLGEVTFWWTAAKQMFSFAVVHRWGTSLQSEFTCLALFFIEKTLLK